MSETTLPTFPFRQTTSVSYGLPFPVLLKLHLDRLGAQKIYLFVSRSLSKAHPEVVDSLRQGLGQDIRIIAEKLGVAPHSNWSEILEICEEIRVQGAPDAFVVLGGGSACDVAKLLVLVDANPPMEGEGYTHDYLARLYQNFNLHGDDKKITYKTNDPPKCPLICIPTTLSAAEYTQFAGCTDDRGTIKKQFGHLGMAPKVVILDGALAQLTPRGVWISTGVRAIDHCLETMCSQEIDDEIEGIAAEGLRKLVPALLKAASGKDTADDRLSAHLGAWKSVTGGCQGLALGGSHAIGHMLGPYGVAHGHTSCVILPFVMRYNKSVNNEKQKKALAVIWHSGEVTTMLERRGLKKDGEDDLCDVLDAVFRELGMPRSLKEVGIGQDVLEEIAVRTLDDPLAKMNPRPFTQKEQVLEILTMAI